MAVASSTVAVAGGIVSLTAGVAGSGVSWMGGVGVCPQPTRARSAIKTTMVNPIFFVIGSSFVSTELIDAYYTWKWDFGQPGLGV